MFIGRRLLYAASSSQGIITLSGISVNGGTSYSGDYNLRDAPITLTRSGSYSLTPQKSMMIYFMGSAGGGKGEEAPGSSPSAGYSGGQGGGGGEFVLPTLGNAFGVQLEGGETYTVVVGAPEGSTYVQDSLSSNVFLLNPGSGTVGGSGGNGTAGGNGGAGGGRYSNGGAGLNGGGGGGGGFGDSSPVTAGGSGGSAYNGGGSPGQDGGATPGVVSATGQPFLAYGGTAFASDIFYGGGGGGGGQNFFRSGTLNVDNGHFIAGGGGGGGGGRLYQAAGGRSLAAGAGILVLDWRA